MTSDLTLTYGLSLAIATLMTLASGAALRFPTRFYPTADLQESFLANDVVNLIIGLPALLGSLWLVRQDRLMGLLLWPGALLYVLYNTIAYVIALPLNLGFLLSLLLFTLSAYTTIGLVASIDGKALKRRLGDAVPETVAGAVLASLGAAFFLRAIGIVIQHLAGHTLVPEADVPVLVSDVVMAPAWVVGGLLLWRREPLGYATGGGLLFLVSVLFVGLIAVLLLQPMMTGAPFHRADTVVVFVMGLVVFIPTGLFLRGVASAE